MRLLFTLITAVFCGFAVYAGNVYSEGKEYTSTAEPGNLNQERIEYTISGYVFSDSLGGTPFEGVTISFSGGTPVITDDQGYYAVTVPRGFTGFVQPSYCEGNYAFTPSSTFYANVKKDYSNENYVGEPAVMFTISGTIEDAQTGEPLDYEIIEFDNGMQTFTNQLGQYSVEVLPCWGDTLRPVDDDYLFEPEYRVYESVTSDMINQDYTYTMAPTYELPPGWDYTNTGTVHHFSVFVSSNPNICGINLQEGDFIGAFYVGDDGELHCGGAGMWTGTENTYVPVFGDDNYTPDIKDGFSWGEEINWKVYSSTVFEDDYPAVVDFQTGSGLVYNNKWYPSGLSIAEDVDAYNGQNLIIPQGWSGISSHLIPGSSSITEMMSPIIDELVIIQSLTKMYYPDAGVNTIGSWNSHQGYKIKVDAPVTLPFLGCPETDKTVDLEATWNIFPVLSECVVQTSELFDPILSDLIVIKEIAGTNVFWPDAGITSLSMLEPGKAYMAAVSTNTSITFQDCNQAKSVTVHNPVSFVNETPWTTPAFTSSSHTVAITEPAQSTLQPGDYIGAFKANGLCAGLAQIQNTGQPVALALFGDDASTAAADGYSEGDPIVLKVYRPDTDEQFETIVSFDPTMPSSTGTYTENGLSAVSSLKLSSTGINEYPNDSFTFYPNPSNGTVNMIAPDDQELRVTLSNSKGQVVFDQAASGKQQFNFSDLKKGIYFLKVKSENNINIEKLILR